ncbi:uncharacterized protein DS421_8g238150 [Arachis hypogaea]|nr:uncharacterized protein DS421_8g238150 [Arachis hypogaea]
MSWNTIHGGCMVLENANSSELRVSESLEMSGAMSSELWLLPSRGGAREMNDKCTRDGCCIWVWALQGRNVGLDKKLFLYFT